MVNFCEDQTEKGCLISAFLAALTTALKESINEKIDMFNYFSRLVS